MTTNKQKGRNSDQGKTMVMAIEHRKCSYLPIPSPLPPSPNRVSQGRGGMEGGQVMRYLDWGGWEKPGKRETSRKSTKTPSKSGECLN